jgi:hypothetical protein
MAFKLKFLSTRLLRPHRYDLIKKLKDQIHNLNFEVVSTESARWTTWWLWKGLWSGSKRTLPSMCSRLNRGSRTPEVPCTTITNSRVSTHVWSSHHFSVLWYDWIDVKSMLIHEFRDFVMILKLQMFAHFTTQRIRNSKSNSISLCDGLCSLRIANQSSKQGLYCQNQQAQDLRYLWFFF